MSYRQRHVISTWSAPPPPTTTTRLHISCYSHVGLVVVAMESHGEHVGFREAEDAATSPSVATPLADDPRGGCGRSDSPLSSTETEDCHSHQGGGGARDARWPTGTDDSTSGAAAGPPDGAWAAAERPQPAALRGDAPPLTVPRLGSCVRRGRRLCHSLLPRTARPGSQEGGGGGEERGGKRRKGSWRRRRRRQRRQALEQEFLSILDIPAARRSAQEVARLNALTELEEAEDAAASSKKKKERRWSRRSLLSCSS